MVETSVYFCIYTSYSFSLLVWKDARVETCLMRIGESRWYGSVGEFFSDIFMKERSSQWRVQSDGRFGSRREKRERC